MNEFDFTAVRHIKHQLSRLDVKQLLCMYLLKYGRQGILVRISSSDAGWCKIGVSHVNCKNKFVRILNIVIWMSFILKTLNTLCINMLYCLCEANSLRWTFERGL